MHEKNSAFNSTVNSSAWDNRNCADETPEMVDLGDTSITYTTENNVWECTSPLLHLAFEQAENLALDSVGNVAGIVNGEPAAVDGIVGSGVQFDAVGDELILPDPMSTVEITGQFTVMTWVNVADFTTKGEAFGRPRDENSQGDVSLNFDSDGQAIIYINGNHVVPGIQLPENTWAHIAVTFNRDARIAKVYFDGDLVYEHIFPANVNFNFDTGREFRLGVGQWRSGSKHFSGSLDEFRIFDEAVSSELIKLQYQIEAPFNP